MNNNAYYQDALSWLTNIVYHGVGAVEIGITSSGDVGIWYPNNPDDESQEPIGTGYDTLEAVLDAMENVAKRTSTATAAPWST